MKCCQIFASQLASWAIASVACHSGENLLAGELEGSYQTFRHPLIGRSSLPLLLTLHLLLLLHLLDVVEVSQVIVVLERD